MKGYVFLGLISIVSVFQSGRSAMSVCPFGTVRDQNDKLQTCGRYVRTLCPEKSYCHLKKGSKTGICCKEFVKSCDSGKQSGDICGTLRGLPCPRGYSCLMNPEIVDDWGICCPAKRKKKPARQCHDGQKPSGTCGKGLQCPTDCSCVKDPLVRYDPGICCPTPFVKQCQFGEPSNDICGTTSGMTCPQEYKCITNPAVVDDWGICCPSIQSELQCKTGTPLANVVCGTFEATPCPENYMCITRSKWAGDAGVCCPGRKTNAQPKNKQGSNSSLTAVMGILSGNNKSSNNKGGNKEAKQTNTSVDASTPEGNSNHIESMSSSNNSKGRSDRIKTVDKIVADVAANEGNTNIAGTNPAANVNEGSSSQKGGANQKVESSSQTEGASQNVKSSNRIEGANQNVKSSSHIEGAKQNLENGNTKAGIVASNNGTSANASQEANQEIEAPEVEMEHEGGTTPSTAANASKEAVAGDANNNNAVNSNQVNEGQGNNATAGGESEVEIEEVQGNAAVNNTVTPGTTPAGEYEAEEFVNAAHATAAPTTPAGTTEEPMEFEREFDYVYLPRPRYRPYFRYWNWY